MENFYSKPGGPPPGSQPAKSMAVNEHVDAAMDDVGRVIFELDKFNHLERFGDDVGWRIRGDNSEFCDRLISLTLCYAPNGQGYVDAHVERCIPTRAFDAKAKLEITVFRRIVSHSSAGEAILPLRTEPAYVFGETHVPPGFSDADWDLTLKEHAALYAEQRAIKAGEIAAIAERNSASQRARAQMADPSGTLAAGISAGIAEALRQLGIKSPKGS